MSKPHFAQRDVVRAVNAAKAAAPSTQRVYRGICERFAAAHGNKPLVGLSRQHLEAMLAKKAVTRRRPPTIGCSRLRC